MNRRPAWLTALLILLFIVAPVAEIWVVVLIVQQIGVLATLGLMAGTSLLGAFLIKREGGKAWKALRQAVGEGSLPEREITDGVLVLAGGVLLILPGFIGDVIGLLMLLPPTRPLGRALLSRIAGRRLGRSFIPGLGTGTVIKGDVIEDEPGPQAPSVKQLGSTETEDFIIDEDGTIRPR